MTDNIHIRVDPVGNIKPDKEKSTEKIDGAVAMIMALDRLIRNENKESVYDEEVNYVVKLALLVIYYKSRHSKSNSYYAYNSIEI